MTKIRQFLNTTTKSSTGQENGTPLKWSEVIKWGGDFKGTGGGGREEVTSTVDTIPDFSIKINEMHHFEIRDEYMAQFFTKYEPKLKELGLTPPKVQNDLANIYAAAFGDYEKDKTLVNQELKDDKTEGDEVNQNSNIDT